MNSAARPLTHARPSGGRASRRRAPQAIAKKKLSTAAAVVHIGS